jgi:ferredoxin/flavodoxin---NADP+ reductase
VTTDLHDKKLIAVIGAGPAGIYASRLLAAEGAYVVLINRDIKPGGLAEYGIYHDKYKMKEGLRKQFRQILEDPAIDYYGNLVVGQDSDLSLEDLKSMGFQAILVTAGAQGTKWLGLPGEDLTGVYHAKDIVYHYNKLPPYSTQEFAIGRRVAIIGVGNVMMDIAHWLIREIKVDEVVAVARRGPAEVKFSKKEMENIALNLDLKHLSREMERVRPIMELVGQDVTAAKDFILAGLSKAIEPVSHTLFRLDFLASPTRILGDDDGRVCGLEIEDTTLVPKNGDTKARGLGTHRILDVDTVIFCIGDRVDDRFGLPIQWNEFVKHPRPQYPINGLSYESYDPETEQAIEGVFVAGWSREASSGLVGVARKDGENGAKAVLQYLEDQPGLEDGAEVLARFTQALQKVVPPVVSKEDIWKLIEIEQAEANRLNLPDFKMKSNKEMLEVMGLS